MRPPLADTQLPDRAPSASRSPRQAGERRNAKTASTRRWEPGSVSRPSFRPQPEPVGRQAPADSADPVGEIGERARARPFRLDDQVIASPGDMDADLARGGIRPGIDRADGHQAEAKRPTARQPCAMRSAGCLGPPVPASLMMTTRMHARADRIRNLEMVGGIFGPDAAGLDRSAKRRRERNPAAGERVVVRVRTSGPGRRRAGARPRPTASQHDQAAAASAHAHMITTSGAGHRQAASACLATVGKVATGM